MADGEICPLGALCYHEGDEDNYFQKPWPEDAAERLSMKREVADRIARAADHRRELRADEKRIRRDLLRACNLKERK